MSFLPSAVHLSSAGAGSAELDEIAERASKVQGRADQALLLAVELGKIAAVPGAGQTRQRWEILATAAAADLTAARVAEAHLDALAILAELGAVSPRSAGSTWGVFAAEGPGRRVDARAADGAWTLSGSKPWCSLADRLTDALITAHTDQGRRLFAISLRSRGVVVEPDQWVARGLVDVPSGPINLESVPAEPVGETEWYLTRPGFAWGGIGVAACWYGGAVGLARTLLTAGKSRQMDQIGLHHLGAVDSALHRARCVLAQAAAEIDDGRAVGGPGVMLAARVRDVVAVAAEEILWRVGHCLGPAPLALDRDHAARVADLELYLRQHHAERDQATLGSSLLAQDQMW